MNILLYPLFGEVQSSPSVSELGITQGWMYDTTGYTLAGNL